MIKGQMNETQILTIALSTVPTMLTVLVGILINNARLGDLNSRLGEMNASVNSRLNDMNTRIAELHAHMNSRFDEVDRRFDEMKDLWRSELRGWKRSSTRA
jgi:ABC-type multidrug transport system fused ATPase/permease subunit